MIYLIIVVISSRISSSIIYQLVTLGSYGPECSALSSCHNNRGT